MGDWFLGEIRVFSFDWAPSGWVQCDGALLPVSQYMALFTLLGTAYGGDGKTKFGVPDLRGRTPIDVGQHTGDPKVYTIGNAGGVESIAIQVSTLPTHNHSVRCYQENGDVNLAKNAYPVSAIADSSNNIPNVYGSCTPGSMVPLNQSSISPAGGGSTHDNMQPFTVVNFCIATTGVYPVRP